MLAAGVRSQEEESGRKQTVRTLGRRQSASHHSLLVHSLVFQELCNQRHAHSLIGAAKPVTDNSHDFEAKDVRDEDSGKQGVKGSRHSAPCD